MLWKNYDNWLSYLVLLFLFNGISTFVVYLMPNPFSEKNINSISNPSLGRADMGVLILPKNICLKVNVIARLEFDLAYYDVIV